MKTYQTRCGECGYVARGKSEGLMDYYLRQHSCERQRERLAAAAASLAREATIDRTPKLCHHKRANHVHGTRACYVLDRCRCLPCTQANSAAETDRERQKLYGRYDKYVDADPVREHMAALAAYGIGLKQVAKLSGVGTGTLWKMIYGRTGNPPSKRVLRTTAERVYAVKAIPANLGTRVIDPRSAEARAKLRSLVALGWSISELGRRLGMHVSNAAPVFSSDRPMKRSTVEAALALFEELSMTKPPETNKTERYTATRARNHAKAHGWLKPLDLDDMDFEDAAPIAEEIDDVAIERRMSGDKSVRLNDAEREELVQRWVASGQTLAACERRTGINPHRHMKKGAA
ncbi:MAG TPA: hypothetical protein VIP77_04795 [Jiangellaceae bacterium]